jgi:DNA adenine methylase
MTAKNPKPFLKWVGGKTRLMRELEKYFPENYNRYFEPFLGSGSVFFNFSPKKATISDLNGTLIDTYISIRDDFNELYKHLKVLEGKNTEKDYYDFRNEFNKLKKENTSKTYVSALMMYLNKAGYGGVYRENKKGEYNVPYGKYKKVNITDKKNLLKIQKSLKNVNLSCSNYSDILKKAKKGDFIYLDPPYAKENKTSFTKYQKSDFDEKEQEKLALLLKKLDNLGVMFLLSNSNTKIINELYKDFTIVEVTVGRHINNKNKGESKKNNEVLIFNYSNNESSDDESSDNESSDDESSDDENSDDESSDDESSDDNDNESENEDKNSKKELKEELDKKPENDIEVKKKTHLNLLKNQEVIDWIVKKGRWLEVKQNKEDNKVEKEWGNSIINQTNNVQWTTNLGETILGEILLVLKGKVWRPNIINGYKPDWETKDGIYEVKHVTGRLLEQQVKRY